MRERAAIKVNNIAYIVVTVLVILVISLQTLQFRQTEINVNELQYISTTELKAKTKQLISSKNILSIDTKILNNALKSEYTLIREIFISKSIIRGIDIEIQETSPIAIINNQEGKWFFYTSENSIVKHTPIDKAIVFLNYTGNMDYLKLKSDNINKILVLIKILQDNQILGSYSFDNFGNFSILTLDNRKFWFDLKETYISIDEQVKVLQNALAKDAYNEIDLRFNYLVVKK